MNKLNEIFSTTFTDALGWTLFHSLWQGAVIAFALYILLLIFRQNQPNIRYLMAVSAYFSILIVTIITFIYQLKATGSAAVHGNESLYFLKAIPSAAAGDLSMHRSSGFTVEHFFAAVDSQIPLLLLGWLLGMFLAACKMGGAYYYMRAKIRKSITQCPDELKQLLPRLSDQLNLSKLVKICEVSFLKVPAVFGHVKPVILIPIGLINHLTPQQVEMVILHELAHIKRNDFLVNLLQSTLEVIFFFNPAVWWISREIRQERENCCDDLIVRTKGQPLQYIKTLAAVNHFNAPGLKLLPGFFGNSKGQLLKRMQRLVGVKTRGYSPQLYKFISLLVVIVSFIYFGWINKNLSSLDTKTQGSLENTKLVFPGPDALSPESLTASPVAQSDTVKEDVIHEQEEKIRKQEKVIEELKEKIEAMEAKERESREEQRERIERLQQRSLEQQRRVMEQQKRSMEHRKRVEKFREQSKRRFDELKEFEIERIEEIRELLEDRVIEELPDLSELDHLNDNIIELNIQERINTINEEVMESIIDIQIPVIADIEMNSDWVQEMRQMQQLELGRIQEDLERALEPMREELAVFSTRMENLKSSLVTALKKDGIITDETGRLRISVRNDRITVNGEALSEKLSDKYKAMIKEAFGRDWKGKFKDDNFNLEFDLD